MPAKKKASSKKPATKEAATSKKPARNTNSGSKRAATTARAGDLIVIDSSKVGSPPREGEVLEVIQGEVRLSYRVRWPDGHESVIAPDSGIARIVPSRTR